MPIDTQGWIYCPECGRIVSAFMPRVGDGTGLRIRVHNTPQGQPCSHSRIVLDHSLFSRSIRGAAERAGISGNSVSKAIRGVADPLPHSTQARPAVDKGPLKASLPAVRTKPSLEWEGGRYGHWEAQAGRFSLSVTCEGPEQWTVKVGPWKFPKPIDSQQEAQMVAEDYLKAILEDALKRLGNA